MPFKTAAIIGLIAISGVMATNDNYPTDDYPTDEYPTDDYPTEEYPTIDPPYPTYSSSYSTHYSTHYSSSYSTAYHTSSSYSAPYHSSSADPHSVSRATSYAVNNTAPTSVWQYYNTTIPTTVVVPQYTTVCPDPTTFTYSGVRYTAITSSQTITVTNCPCTVSTTIHTITSSLVAPGVTPTAVATAVPGTTTTGGHSPATNPAPSAPAGGNSVPAGAAPAVPTTPAASVSATHTSSPTSIEISGASSTKSGIAVALFAAIMGALAL
ncbi:hypothetical protein K449DRAFT_397395 [Hypoxylon sp. EC38]|nr:hypothetical protein K449DRAFT_397395 [Hypoxylon sp. EC38]